MFQSVLGFLAACVILVVFLGAAVVFLRGSRDKGTIETLGKNNEALTERVSLLEKNEARLTTRVTFLERENLDLRMQRPSAEAIAELHALVENQAAMLSAQLAKQHAQQMALLRKSQP